jgi:hypothetical protein
MFSSRFSGALLPFPFIPFLFLYILNTSVQRHEVRQSKVAIPGGELLCREVGFLMMTKGVKNGKGRKLVVLQ